MTWKSLTGQTSQTSHWLSSTFEPAQSWRECMRVDESWRSNEPNLSLTLINIWTSSKLTRVHESAWELMRVGGQTSQTSHWLSSTFKPAQSWRECMRVHESWWELAVKRERELRSTLIHSHPRLVRPKQYNYFLDWFSYFKNRTNFPQLIRLRISTNKKQTKSTETKF